MIRRILVPYKDESRQCISATARSCNSLLDFYRLSYQSLLITVNCRSSLTHQLLNYLHPERQINGADLTRYIAKPSSMNHSFRAFEIAFTNSSNFFSLFFFFFSSIYRFLLQSRNWSIYIYNTIHNLSLQNKICKFSLSLIFFLFFSKELVLFSKERVKKREESNSCFVIGHIYALDIYRWIYRWPCGVAGM